MQPYYNTTEKMKRGFLNSRAIEKMMATVMQQLQEPLVETLSPGIVSAYHLMSLTEALRNIHFPQSPELLRKAQYRLKFEELFYVQLNILRYSKDRQRKYRGYVFENVGAVFHTFYEKNLPFELTGAQKRVFVITSYSIHYTKLYEYITQLTQLRFTRARLKGGAQIS